VTGRGAPRVAGGLPQRAGAPDQVHEGFPENTDTLRAELTLARAEAEDWRRARDEAWDTVAALAEELKLYRESRFWKIVRAYWTGRRWLSGVSGRLLPRRRAVDAGAPGRAAMTPEATTAAPLGEEGIPAGFLAVPAGRLVAHLQDDPSIGVICPTTNFCGNEARVEPGYSHLSGLPAYAARRGADHRGRVFDIPVAAMYCVAMRADVFAAIGPLDEAYGIGMFEDDDFAMRVRNAGYRVVCAEDAYVHHVGQGGFERMPPDDYDQLWRRNREYFERKWGATWVAHTPRGGIVPVASKVHRPR
jgi:hypothetical protein